MTTRPVALVTGASRGIGKAAAVKLAAAGYDVGVSARTLRDGEGRVDTDPTISVPGGLDTTVEAIETHGVSGFAVRMDVLDRPTLLDGTRAVLDHFGRIDVLVNNAIYQGPGSMLELVDLEEDELRRMFDGNVFAQLAMIKAVLPHMTERGSGTIINMISATAYTDPPARIGSGGWGMGYAMTKAAFARVAPLLEIEVGEQGIRSFSVDPGFVPTEKSYATNRVSQFSQHFVGAPPEAIGAVIAWLAHDPAADELRGKVVIAQRECKRRGLLPGWPPPRVPGD
ncbi:MAG TPA: SDR family oxidoreductase [Acidimicrobiales bacterium]|jgi:NAD(P)-dependent dehydrogenase (short-subunit alcohol dehydrogenase family)|nr:SDR family oxidoreductase [Acidimicrobiales bacterium]